MMFHSARLKLTAWYLMIIMLISIMFSVVIYKVTSHEVERFERIQRFRIERLRRFPDQIPIAPELLEETKHRILFILIVINSGILIIAGGLGYILAGRTLAPIKEMVDEQNRFITDASHEMRTPLTSLKSAFEVYLRSNTQTLAEAQKLVGESIGEVNKLQSLSESLLQLAQYQKPDDRYLKFEKLSLTQVIKDAIRKIELIARQKEIAITYDAKQIEIMGNKYGLGDLILILLDNAVKYSPQASKIIVKTKRTENFVTVSIKDQGIGIHQKDISCIFDRFYRTDRARSKSDSTGYGLGLSIAKKIVEVHKGTIQVESRLGKGSVFEIKLPISFFS